MEENNNYLLVEWRQSADKKDGGDPRQLAQLVKGLYVGMLGSTVQGSGPSRNGKVLSGRSLKNK